MLVLVVNGKEYDYDVGSHVRELLPSPPQT